MRRQAKFDDWHNAWNAQQLLWRKGINAVIMVDAEHYYAPVMGYILYWGCYD